MSDGRGAGGEDGGGTRVCGGRGGSESIMPTSRSGVRHATSLRIETGEAAYRRAGSV